MKIYAYCFCKTNNRNKAQPIFLMGGDLRMRYAHKNKTNKVFVLGLKSPQSFCTDFAIFLCVCIFKAPGNPAFTYAPLLLVSFGSRDFVEAVSTLLKSPYSLPPIVS